MALPSPSLTIFRETVVVAAPIGSVYERLTNVDRWPTWATGVRSSALEAPVRVGAKLRFTPAMELLAGALLGGRDLTLNTTVLDLEPGVRFAWGRSRLGSGIVHGFWLRALGPDRTEVDQHEYAFGAGALAAPIGRFIRAFDARLGQDLVRSFEVQPIRYLHTMLRVKDLDRALRFFVEGLGLRVVKRKDVEAGRYTLVFLASGAPGDPAEIELTYNWDQAEPYPTGRFFGHLAFEVADVYAACARLEAQGHTIHRPPRDGRMAFVKSPDGQSVELLQQGEPRPKAEPWASRANVGEW